MDELATALDDYGTKAAYSDGLHDGALSVLAPALGVQPESGSPTHTLMGRRFNVTINWLDDEPDPGFDEVARRIAQEARLRMKERGEQ